MNKVGETNSEEALDNALKMFKCDNNRDIDGFLQEKAITFVKRNICRVYLLLNEADFEKGIIHIEAYFTLSISSLNFEEKVSGSMRKRITGFKDRKVATFVLIGHLGKYIETDVSGKTIDDEVNLDLILEYIYELIHSVNELVACNTVLIECSEQLHKKGLYKKAGFKLLQ